MAKATGKTLRALGRKVTTFTAFDVFRQPDGLDEVQCTSDEVTALCPVTSQPDWYVVTITYRPNGACVESKSLKLYLHSMRSRGVFCEELATTIMNDLKKVLKPYAIAVEVKQKARGGIAIHATANDVAR